MKKNLVVQTLLDHKSIRKFSDKTVSDKAVTTIVQAGQQAPFASQYYSVLLSRNIKRNPMNAPLLFTICIDSYKFEKIMAKRNWKPVTNDLTLLLFGIQDAALMAENMVIAGRSLDLGSCFLGGAPFKADKIAEEYNLPQRVFPLVQLVMGYPSENPPTRPRYPIEYTLFEDKYPQLTEELVTNAMRIMDEGYLAQDYYRSRQAKIPLTVDRKETFTYDNYSWTEHICRKWGQWFSDPADLCTQLEKRGFNIEKKQRKKA
ncbi:MAG: nitroreductase family protein [Candidatus Bathyarchaeia archaeon]|nr:nitroreductase family protein [Candidatus Bathyarchaeota archaeon]